MLPNKKVKLNSKNKEKFKRNFSAASGNKTTENKDKQNICTSLYYEITTVLFQFYYPQCSKLFKNSSSSPQHI